MCNFVHGTHGRKTVSLASFDCILSPLDCCWLKWPWILLCWTAKLNALFFSSPLLSVFGEWKHETGSGHQIDDLRWIHLYSGWNWHWFWISLLCKSNNGFSIQFQWEKKRIWFRSSIKLYHLDNSPIFLYTIDWS